VAPARHVHDEAAVRAAGNFLVAFVHAEIEVHAAPFDRAHACIDAHRLPEQRRADVLERDGRADGRLAFVRVIEQEIQARLFHIAHQLGRRVDAQVLAQEVDRARAVHREHALQRGAGVQFFFHAMFRWSRRVN
jgi:hypothetical protein